MGSIGRDDEEVDFEELRNLTKLIMDKNTAIKKSEAMFRAIYERSVTAIALTEEDGRIIDCNKSFCKLTGFTGEDIQGKSILSLIEGELPTIEATRFLVRQILNGEKDHYHIEKHIRVKEGGTKICRISVSCAFDGTGRIIFIVGVFEDITEIVQLRERVGQLEEQLKNCK